MARTHSQVAAALSLLLLLLSAAPAAAGRRDLLQAKVPPASLLLQAKESSPSVISTGRLLVALSKDGADQAGKGGSSLNTLAASIANAASVTSVRVLPHLNIAVAESSNTALSADSLSKQPSVKSVSEDVVVHISGMPNDALYGTLWGMDKVEAPAAWDVATGSHDVVVCVIDTGVDYLHEDLVNNMWTNPGEVPGNGIDDDNNGFIDDVHGINAITMSGDPMDDHMHGTHCAGTVGAQGNNTVGVVGVAPNVSIMGCKFLSASDGGAISDALTCLEYAVAMGARISSNSWGGGSFSAVFEDALNAAGLAGHLFIAAAGNSARDNDITPSYPASYSPTVDAVISVASVASNDMLSGFSQWGARSVDLAAPGSGINSCAASVIGGGYTSISGTSMATPHVSGAAALLLSHNPDLTPLQIKQMLMGTCTPAPALQGLVVSNGILNVRAAITGEAPDPIDMPDPTLAQSFAGDFDLAQSSITFSGPDYAPCQGQPAQPPAAGTALSLSDDASVAVEFTDGFSFAFYGQQYERVFVGSNGYLTFGEGDASYSPSISNHSRLPRISALYTDLTPDAESTISYVQAPGEFVVVYSNIKRYGQDGQRSTFAVALRLDGSVTVSFQEVVNDAAIIVGLGNGGYSQAADLSASAPCESSSSQPQPTTQPPATTTQPPTTTAQPPATTAQPPATTAQPPATTTQPPATTAQPPATTAQPPATTTQPPQPEQPAPRWEMFWPSRPFDLAAYTTLTFDGASNYTPCRTLSDHADGSFPHDPATATLLPLGDDDSQLVAFTGGFVFTFFESEYTGVYIGSNGYLTFEAPDTRFAASAKNHHAQPRVSALYADLMTDAQSAISYEQLADAFVVTYDNVIAARPRGPPQ
eukprot:jgi/Tetstr1/431640/TSEL_021170.t1